MRLMIEVDAGRMPTNVRAWLYRVIANLAVSRGRRATVARRGLRAVAERDDDQGPEPPTSRANAARTWRPRSASSAPMPALPC